MRPVDRNELLARVRTQIKRKRHSDHLRGPAGGERRARPHRRAHRAAQPALHGDAPEGARRAGKSSRPAAVGAVCRHRQLQVDQRHLRARRRGHRAARACLAAAAATPATSTWHAASAARSSSSSCPTRCWSGPARSAERLRACIAGEPFQADGETRLQVTASVGIATLDGVRTTPRRGSSSAPTRPCTLPSAAAATASSTNAA